MSRKLFAVGIVFFVAMGCASMAPLEGKGEKEGISIPVIAQSFASKEIRPGDTWKVYLNVSDPDGEMKNIFALVEQPGVGPYPISIMRIKKENSKELSGYIYLNTSTSRTSLEFVTLTLTVHVQDGSGNFSQPVVFPVSFSTRFVQEVPPPGVFKEQDLGPIMVTLGIIDDEHRDRDRDRDRDRGGRRR